MLTRRQVFEGETVSHVLAGVLAKEPQWSTLPLNLHPRIRQLLERCLEKESKDRYGDISDARVDIQKVLADPDGVIVQPVASVVQAPPRSMAPWALATLGLVVVASIAVWILKPELPNPVTRFPYPLPANQFFTQTSRPLVAISPDGTKFVYVANQQLYLKNLDEMEARPIPGTDENVSGPFFSPDGEWIGFHSAADNQLKKIAIAGGVPVPVCDAFVLNGASWASDDSIVFGQPQGILRVSANGGTPELLIERAEGELFLAKPRILPDGESLLFMVASTGGGDAARHLDVQSLDTGERKVLVEPGSNGRYVATGHILYSIQDVLYAIPFDLDRLERTGGPIPLLAGMNETPAHFDVSEEGVFVYVAGEAISEFSFMWVDMHGTVSRLIDEKREYDYPRVSPDGERVAVTVLDEDLSINIWVYDIRTGTGSQLTDDERLSMPAWTPDGDRITYQYGDEIYWRAADGSGPPELLWDGENPVWPMNWSRDGRFLAFGEYHPGYTE